MSASVILKLQSAGFNSEQVAALAELVDSQAASKADLQSFRSEVELRFTEVKAEFRRLEGELRAELRQQDARAEMRESRIVIKLGAMLAAMIGMLFVALRYAAP